MWGGEEYIIAPKENKKMVKFLADHFAWHLANKILMKEGRDWGNDSPDKAAMIAKILGKEEPIIPVAAPENFQLATTVPPIPLTVEKEEEFPDIPKESVTIDTVYKCPTCGKEFKHPLALAGHKRSHKA